MSTQKPYWKDKNFWLCPKHLPSIRMPRSVSICYFSNCTSVRPREEQNRNTTNNVIQTIPIRKEEPPINIKPEPVINVKTEPLINIKPETPKENSVAKIINIVKLEDKNKNVSYCTLDGCENVIPENSNRRIYCSDICRKKFARAQYRLRMKEKKENASK